MMGRISPFGRNDRRIVIPSERSDEESLLPRPVFLERCNDSD
jgi:hypothetical protein